MNGKRRWLWLALALGLVALGALGLYRVSDEPGPPSIHVEPPNFDWGEIPNDRPVTQTFTVENAGGRALEIVGVSTSCGCTTAHIERERLAPGEHTPMEVVFDPTTHGNLTGPVLRVVYVRSNDPDDPEVSVELRATLVAPEPGTEPEKGDRP